MNVRSGVSTTRMAFPSVLYLIYLLFSTVQKATSSRMVRCWLSVAMSRASRSRLTAINSKRMSIRGSMSYSKDFAQGSRKGASLNPRLRQKFIKMTLWCSSTAIPREADPKPSSAIQHASRVSSNHLSMPSHVVMSSVHLAFGLMDTLGAGPWSR